MAKEKSVLVKQEGKVLNIEFNRPDTLNAMDEEMLKELLVELKKAVTTDTDILIITGNGKAFSAGGDLRSMLNTEGDALCPVIDEINELILTLYTMPKVTISAIKGPAVGISLSIALATDYIIAEEESILAMNFIKIGLVPDGGGHFFLYKRLGEAKAKQLMWSGRNLNANEAYNMGVIDEIVQTDVYQRAKKKAISWLNSPLLAMIESKKILTEQNKQELIATLEMEKEAQIKMRKTADHIEGVTAFLEKRKPKFTGR